MDMHACIAYVLVLLCSVSLCCVLPWCFDLLVLVGRESYLGCRNTNGMYTAIVSQV